MSPRRPHPWCRAAGTVAALAVAAYMAAGLFGLLSPRPERVQVYLRSLEEGFTARGIIIRSERSSPPLDAPEGLRLGVGEACAAGLYFAQSDGFLSLSPGDIPALDAEGLEHLLRWEPSSPGGGRIITGKDWYYAALCPSDSQPEEGESLGIDFGLGEIPARVVASGEGFAVLAMDTGLADHAHLRKAEAKIITENISGIAIPAEALCHDAEGSFVWAVTAGRLEKKTVNIIFTGADFYLAEAERELRSLRSGDWVVTDGEELYEGKILT